MPVNLDRSQSPNSSILQRTIEINYAKRKRSISLKWSVVNAILFLVFAYDLSCKCPGYTSLLHYMELALAAISAANLLQHLVQLLPRRDPVLTLTQQQQKLLGLSDSDLDSSFCVVERSLSTVNLSTQCPETQEHISAQEAMLLSPPRGSPSARTSPSSQPSQCSPTLLNSSVYTTKADDRFIADSQSLGDYLKEYEERRRLAQLTEANRAWGVAPASPPYYALSAPDHEYGAAEERCAARALPAWWRLQLDPQRLAHWTLNLRLWIHLTILERLVREMDLVDEELAKHGFSDVRIGNVSVERLRSAARSSGIPSLTRMLSFLEPFPDQQYIVRRIRELARGGCLSEYKWEGGGVQWDASQPTDTELVLQLVCAYLDAQAAPGSRRFSDAHVAPESPGAPGPPAVTAPALLRTGSRPPHFVVWLGEERVEVSRGRSNLFHSLLLLVAAAAARDPPQLARLHLGPAGLNMLWIIGR